MRRLLVAVALTIVLGACAGGDEAAPTPRPSGERGILSPIDRAQDTADTLERVQEREEQQGESYYGRTP